MDEFQRETVKLSLNKMLNGSSHFSICDVDKLGKLLGVNPESHRDYKTLHALHCVHYTEMSEIMKAELPNKIMGVLSAKFETDLMSKALAAIANGEVKDWPEIEDVEVTTKPKLRLFKS